MKTILITAANGMFGSKTAEVLAADPSVHLRLMMRDPAKCRIKGPHVEIRQVDFDRPDTMEDCFRGVDSVFLVSPMDPRMTERENAMVELCVRHGVKSIVKMAGAVKHEDELSRMHGAVLDKVKASGAEWALVSPNSVMETTLLPYVETIRTARAIFSCAADARVGLVSLKNVAEITAMVLSTPGHHAKDYVLTGPRSLTLTEVAAAFTSVLGKKIDYVDLSEEDFTRLLMKYDKSLTPERVELEVLCHMRAWKQGGADVVSDTYRQLTGREPMSVEDFIRDNLSLYKKGMMPSFMVRSVRKSMLK